MIKTSKQLKDLIRNLSKKKSADAQILMRNYMMERFLERISISEYKDKFILKGGMLVASMVGLEVRSTMDIDGTIKGADVNVESVRDIISTVIAVPLDDGVKFSIKNVVEIMDEAEYPGVRVGMETEFDGVRTPLKIDISTGDIITPKEIRYSFKLMLEERFIDVWAYNLETVLAEKLETVISRNVTNTRMRDFYDIFVLLQLYENELDKKNLHDALEATAQKRGTIQHLSDATFVFDEVQNSSYVQKLWESYQKKYAYAKDGRLGKFLDIDEELLEYKTKTGRVRKRKTLIGNFQGNHDTMTGIVDVAMIRSLKKKKCKICIWSDCNSEAWRRKRENK